MTATTLHANHSTFKKVKEAAKKPDTYIKVGCLTVFGSMTVLDLGLAILFFVFAAGIIDILLGLFFLGGAMLFGGMFIETLTEW